MFVRCAWCRKKFDADERDLMFVSAFAIAMGFRKKDYICWPCWKKAHEKPIVKWKKHKEIEG